MEVIADYRILEQLGRGTAGRTFLAEPPARLGLGEPCVVKVLDRPIADDEFTRVAEELRIVAALRAARVVEVFEVGLHRGELFTAMRHHPEGGLDGAGHLPDAVRLRVLADAAHGVHALHQVGIVHRQVTPANILLSGGRGLVSEPSLAPLVAPGLTSTGTGTLATLAFLEPEVIWGEAAGRSTDVWSLGVTLHQVVTGQSVYPALPDDSTVAAFRHVLHTRPVIVEALPSVMREIVERCLAARRSDRFATALDVARAIERTIGGGAAPAVAESPDLPTDARVVNLRAVDGSELEGREPLAVEGSVEVSPDDAPDEVVVQGVRCARGHLNNPVSVTCARCGIKLLTAGGALISGSRPPLGVLTFDDGEAFALARDAVLGREPTVDPLVVSGQAQGLRVTDAKRTVSRAHAVILLIGWDAFLEDRGSSNGTSIRSSPAQPWRRLAAGERVALVAGTGIRLGERELSFEQHGVL